MTPIDSAAPGDGRPLTAWLSRSPSWVLSVYAISASFCTYFCMYAFRKPFTAATFADQSWGPVDLKTALVIGQLVGYTLSKYLGIKVCSEVTPQRRAAWLVGLIAAAELALVAFYSVPNSWKIVAIFANGLPLGMVWGMVVAYLEGRKTSELLLAGLSCSYIVASGAVKSVGRWLVLERQVSEAAMPALTGALFLVPFLVAVWLLHQMPRPDQIDMALRVEREPMDRARRMSFLRTFWPGLAMLLVAYFFLTAYRDFRDNYQVEIVGQLGYHNAAVLAQTELWVAFGVIAALAALNLIADNRWGLIGAYAIMTTGTLLMGLGTLALDAELVDGVTWMVLVGLGSYLAYVPYGSVLFDRLIASTRVAGTAVFTIYVADALGYTGSIGVLLYKDLAQGTATRLAFFRLFTYFMSVLGTLLLAASCGYFLKRHVRSGLNTAGKDSV